MGAVSPYNSPRAGISKRSALCVASCLALSILSLAPASGAWGQQPRVAGAARSKTLPPPSFSSSSGILLDADSGKIFWSNNDRIQRAPASLTKVLTALVVLENADLESKVTITREARAAAGSRTYAEAGWVFSVEDLLYGLLLSSGNDAAIALAQAVSPDGSVDRFMAMVNQRAAQMGAKATHFENPHGLDEPGHTTTARDMALITMTALKNRHFARMVATQKHRVPWGDGTMRSFQNHNKLLARFPGSVGVKTGFTKNARHTLASAAQREGATLVAVTLGSPAQYEDSIRLFNWGFENLSSLRAGAAEGIWPPESAGAAPAAEETGGPGLVGDALRLLGSFGEPTPASPNRISIAAMGSFVGASLALVGFAGFRNQRRLRQEPAAVSVARADVPARPEVPYVIR